MAKRPDTSDTTRLAIELLRRIPRKRKITAAELHAQLESMDIARDIRSIQRQLEKLSEYFDIERDERSKPYGYRWKEQAEGLSLPGLTEKESLLLCLAEQHLRNLLPEKLMKSMEGFFRQARQNLGPDASNKNDREWLQKVRVVSTSQPLIPPTIKPGVFEAVSNALYSNNWLEVDYTNASDYTSMSTVMPLGLAQQGPRLYLVCRFKGFENERSLALHRMKSARATSLAFTRPKDFDLQKYDDDGRFGFGDGRKIQLCFNIRKDSGLHLKESPLSHDQLIEEMSDHFKITASVIDSKMLQWWLNGFGDSVWGISKTEIKDLTRGHKDAKYSD